MTVGWWGWRVGPIFFRKKHTENPDLYLFFFFWNGVFFMDGLKYVCRHLLSFLRSLSFKKTNWKKTPCRLCASFVNRVLWVPQDVLILYGDAEGPVRLMTHPNPTTGCHSLFLLSLCGTNRTWWICTVVMNHVVQNGIK